METATVTMTLHLPRVLVQQYPTVRTLEDLLHSLGLWPDAVVSSTWHIDPMTTGYTVQMTLEVPLVSPETQV